MLRKKRHNARSLLALPLEKRIQREKELLGSLSRLGILSGNAMLDDVLTLGVESFFERRLQTIVWRKGLANTAIQARQFVVHGHVAIDGRRVTAPSYLVSAEEEAKIGYYAGKKMVLKPAEKDVKKAAEKKESVKEAFEAAKPEEEQQNAVDVLEAIRAARKQAKAHGQEKKPEGGDAEKAVGEEATVEEEAEGKAGDEEVGE
jgi:small subunit ribosomal protein S4